MAQLVIRQTDVKIPKRSSSSVNGSQGSASTAAEALTLDIEAEHLPVVMSARDFVNRSELAAIQTLARVYCADQKTSTVTVHPRIPIVSAKTCSSTLTDL